MGYFIKRLPVTEADLLARFYRQAANRGLDIRMEVILPSALHRSGRMRVDAALVKGQMILALIEGKTPGAKIGGNTRQKFAYEKFKVRHGVPTFWINSENAISGLIDSLQGVVDGDAA